MPVVAHAAKPLLVAAPAAECVAFAGGVNIREQGLAPTGIRVARAAGCQRDPSLWEPAPASEVTMRRRVATVSKKLNPTLGCSSPQSGFTLIELLVVMAIAALVLGVAPIAFDRLQSASQFRDAVRGMLTGLRQTRQMALQQGQPKAFNIDHRTGLFGPEGANLQKIPSSVNVKTTVGTRQGQANENVSQIVFFPDGGSTGGLVDLVRSSGQSTRIRVDWLFGQITQEPRKP